MTAEQAGVVLTLLSIIAGTNIALVLIVICETVRRR